jgi:hypothetical protein
MMTRKDYVKTAEILSSYKDLIGDEFTYHDLVDEFASMFSEDNTQFNSDKFFNACMINVY